MVFTTRPHALLKPAQRIVQSFAAFARLETSGSIVLLGAFATALFFANTSLATLYERFLSVRIGIDFANLVTSISVRAWISDALMAVFFLVVGLEVKREVLVGELASLRRASLPVIGALGGMVAPALLYLAFNHGKSSQQGWGIPIATDIAFSLAILTALGDRVPTSLRIFLASLAIADDVGGVVVIALAYTASFHLVWLLIAGGLTACGLLLNRFGVVRPSLYLGLGVLIWGSMHASGIHPTLAGVALACVIPATPSREQRSSGRHKESQSIHTSKPPQAASRSTLDRIERRLHPWISYGVIPLFAFANAGVKLTGVHADVLTRPVFLGACLGLLLGKPLGIMLACLAAVRLRLASMPNGVSWAQLHAASWVAGIGFTVSVFIAGLAFGSSSFYTEARLAIVVGSAVAAIVGATLLACSSDAIHSPKQLRTQ